MQDKTLGKNSMAGTSPMNHSITEPLHADTLDSDQSSLNYENRIFSEVTWRDQKISKNILFSNCEFEGLCDFEGTIFEGELQFHHCIFNDFVIFRGSRLPDHAVFEDCKFNDGVSFAAGLSKTTDSPTQELKLQHLRFRRSTFAGYVTFNNRTFTRSADFKSCVFFDPPHFQNSQYHQGTSFDNAEFIKPTFDDPERLAKAERGYRRLKSLMHQIGNIDRQSEFLALEFLVRRRRKDISLFEKAIILLYDLGSDFGRSLTRPIVFLFILSVMHFLILSFTSNLSWNELSGGNIMFLLENSVSPFKALHSAYEAPAGIVQDFIDHAPLFRTIGALQSVIVLLSLTLFAFAVRRRFSQ